MCPPFDLPAVGLPVFGVHFHNSFSLAGAGGLTSNRAIPSCDPQRLPACERDRVPHAAPGGDNSCTGFPRLLAIAGLLAG